MKLHKSLVIFAIFFTILLSVFLTSIFWDLIKLNYDESNLIKAEAFYRKINPSTNVLRFLIFVIIPISIFLFSYIFFLKRLA